MSTKDRHGTVILIVGGVTIGQYRVTGLIAQGGMGAVYAGEHVLLGRPAAIKVLLPELSQKQDIVMRFFNEARAATAIRNPGIVEIYDFGWSTEGAAFIVMEHLQGETLAQRSSRTRFDWRSALTIARQIAGALAAAHAKGIIHRDLKPENIFLVPDPEVPGGERIKLLDFGIAKLVGDALSGMKRTKTGEVMGTPMYMAPEQCRGAAADHRADLYALGCIVFELCSGHPPFTGEGTGDILAAHIHMPVPSVTNSTTEVPYAVEQLIQRLLAKSPAERVQSAEQLIRTIDAITTDKPPLIVDASSGPLPKVRLPSFTTPSGASSEATPTVAAKRRRRWIGFAAAASILVAIVAMRGGDDDVPPGPPAVVSPPVIATASPKLAHVEPASVPVHSQSAVRSPTLGVPVPPQPPARPATVDVSIETVPAGAQVTLAGIARGKTPFHGELVRRHGDVTLMIRLEGYVDQRVVLRADQPISEHIKLVRKTPVHALTENRDQSVNPFGD